MGRTENFSSAATAATSYFDARSRFFFDNGRCMFCPGSGAERARPRTQRSAIILPAVFADINITRADLYRKRNGHEEEWVAEKQVSFSADGRENQGARRLAGV